MEGSPKRVFISYARSASLEHALALQRALGPDACFLDVEDIPPDSQFPIRLADALLSAHLVVVLASSVYFQRWYCLREWLLARAPWDARPVGVPANNEQGRLEHLIITLDQLDPNDLYLLPQPIQNRNLLPITALDDVTRLVRDRLANSTVSLGERFEVYRVPRESVEMLIGTHVLPVPPQTLSGIPVWPPSMRPSLGDQFVGRANEFWRLHDALWSTRVGGAAAAGLTSALHGGGGFGKTQLALEYFHRMGPRLYRGGLLWIDGSEASAPLRDQFHGILQEFPDVVRELNVDLRQVEGLPEPAMRELLGRVLHRLGPSPPVLFVVDNVPEPTSTQPARDLSEYCPGLGRVTCVVTSRAKLTHVSSISVDVVSTDAAVLLLQKGVAHDALSASEWRELAEWVGLWPLGLDHLNAFMRLDPVSPHRLLERSRTRELSAEIGRMVAILRNEMPKEAVRGVADIFASSLDSLSATARELLFRSAWLAPAPIPRPLLEAMCGDDEGSDSAIVPLVSRSWLKPAGGDSLMLHRVIAGYLRAAQSDSPLRTEGVVKTMQSAWNAMDMQASGSPDASVALAPHAAAIIESAARLGCPLYPLRDLLRTMRRVGSRVIDSGPLVFDMTASTRVMEIVPEHQDHQFGVAFRVTLGEALLALGYREGDSKRLEEAVAVFLEALPLLQGDRFQAEWAAAQNGLGVALMGLGDRAQDKGRLEQAIAAFRGALQVYTRDHFPSDWARVEHNLGGVFRILGDRDRDLQRLDEAVIAFKSALEVRIESSFPRDWAETQMSLGNALQSLGERTRDPQRLEEAVVAFRAALQVSTREQQPLEWARTQNNLGIALETLANVANDNEILSEAVTAFRAALQVLAKDDLPYDWAMTQNNLAVALRSLGSRAKDDERLQEAVAIYRDVLEVRTKDRLPIDWAATQRNLGNALVVLGNHQERSQALEEAVSAFRAALEVYSKQGQPADWAGIQKDLGLALWLLGLREQDVARLEESAASFDAALAVYTRDRFPDHWTTTQQSLGMVLLLLAYREWKGRWPEETAYEGFRRRWRCLRRIASRPARRVLLQFFRRLLSKTGGL